jgi:4-hydroxy-tetrahydrodipicolinate synthase
MVTPATPQGELDEEGARRVTEHLIAGGIHGVFVLGTNGEGASVDRRTGRRLVSIVAGQSAGRATVFAGVSSNSLADSVEAAEVFFGHGADVVVAHPPYYFPLGPEELMAYYTALADRISGPLIIYNIPSTTHVSVPIDVVEALSEHPRIAGIKDSEEDVGRLGVLMERLAGRDDFTCLVGAANLAARGMALGADGFVPGNGNLIPRACRALYDSGLAGATTETYQRQIDEVAGIYHRGRPLREALAALKAAMGVLDLCGPDMMPPLRALEPREQEAVREVFRSWYAQQTGL